MTNNVGKFDIARKQPPQQTQNTKNGSITRQDLENELRQLQAKKRPTIAEQERIKELEIMLGRRSKPESLFTQKH